MSRNPGGDDQNAGGGDDAPLHEALDDLEHMLGPGGLPETGRRSESGDSETAGFASPARARPAAPLGAAEAAGTTGMEAWDAALHRMAAERLSSELEIIVNARLEAALARLCEELRRELQNHIEIVLPEIVSSLAADDIPPRYE